MIIIFDIIWAGKFVGDINVVDSEDTQETLKRLYEPVASLYKRGF